MVYIEKKEQDTKKEKAADELQPGSRRQSDK